MRLQETIIKHGFVRTFPVFLCEGVGDLKEVTGVRKVSLRQKGLQEWIYRDQHFTASLISLATEEYSIQHDPVQTANS